MKLKALHINALLAMLMAFPLTAFPQSSNGSRTRAQVLQDLYDLEDVGYRPAQASSLRFPDDIEAAERRLAAKRRIQLSGSTRQSSAQADSKLDTPLLTDSIAHP
jgi:Domain of unknown function (DUF4148)